MPTFYLRTFVAFFVLRVLSVLLHFLGPSPWGGALVLSPSRLIPEALFMELMVWTLVVGLLATGEFLLVSGEIMSTVSKRVKGYRGVAAFVCAFLAVFSQVDFEVVRWLGQHMTLSYVQNFAGARDGALFARIFSGDLLFSVLAGLQMLLAVVIALWLGWRYAATSTRTRLRSVGLAVVAIAVLSPLPFLLRPSAKRLRRVQPASVGIVREALQNALGTNAPRFPKRAMQDLVDLVYTGRLGRGVVPVDREYPLVRDDNLGELSVAQFTEQPLSERPDVIVIVFETLRGINTGWLAGGPANSAAMPQLAQLAKSKAHFFPRVHSAGYPSVEGALGIHLGMWPHHSRIVFSSYLHDNTLSFVEILRNAGYASYALLGADPSFSNFTPWFRRFYDEMEYNPARHHDGPLVDRAIALYEQRLSSPEPQMFTLWTATTHPPYDVPKETGILPKTTNEERYLQAMRYADEHITRLIRHIMASPRFEHTLIFVLGDHAQPTPWQWQHTEEIGELNPGHTWTSLSIFGGGKFAPAPKRDERSISHIDLAPTILTAVNLKHDNHFFGRDVLGQGDERPVVAFRHGTMSVEWQQARSVFDLESHDVRSYGFNPSDVLSYGGLEGGQRTPHQPVVNTERYADMARAWSQLLDEDRVMRTGAQ